MNELILIKNRRSTCKPISNAAALAFIVLVLLFSCQSPAESEAIEEPYLETKFEFSLVEHERITKASIRGLYMMDEQVAWASGSEGTVLRCTDGENWRVQQIEEAKHLDLRDIHAFDSLNAVTMAAGEEGRIFRTEDGGDSWEEVYTDLSEGVFLDGMDFHDSLGICYGDPIDGRFYGVFSKDFGHSWTKASMNGFPEPLEGEAGFAASGTGIVVLADREYTATGGGTNARVIRSMRELESDFRTEAFNTPLKSEEGCGIFSLAFQDTKRGVAVGGCYLDSTSTEGNCAYTTDGGEHWQAVTVHPPNGYRSCVAYNEKNKIYFTCGRTGIDYALFDPSEWSFLTKDGFFTCDTYGDKAWFMGRDGKISKLSIKRKSVESSTIIK